MLVITYINTLVDSSMIVERDGEFCVVSKDGKRSFGCYATKAAAEDRLGQVEYFKREGNMKRLFVNVNMAVNRDMIRRETRNGAEFIIINSATLPDNVVMNGGLYPSDEIERGFNSLEGTLAPLGHPVDADGNLLSAVNADAIDNFYVGARNENVRRENGRVWMDKVINVQVARKSDKGQRLLDRIEALESGAGAPIHTSTGLLLSREDGEGVSNGKEYKWIARNMQFDHDAILLDEPGAATPDEGVGMAVNANGEQVQVMNVNLDAVGNAKSLNQIRDMLNDAVREKYQEGDESWVWVEDVYPDHLIFERDGKLHRVDYTIEGDSVSFGDQLTEVKREIKYSPMAVINKLAKMLGFAQSTDTAYNSDSEYSQTQEVDPMKEQIVQRLKAANAYQDGMSDADALAAYVKLEANAEQKPETDVAAITAAVNAAVAPLAEKIEAVEAQANAQAEAEKAQHVETVVNAGLLEKEDAEKLGADVLAKMAANCAAPAGGAMRLNPALAGNSKDDFNLEMPE